MGRCLTVSGETRLGSSYSHREAFLHPKFKLNRYMVFCALILSYLSHLYSCGYLCDFLVYCLPLLPTREPHEGRYQECFPTSVFSRLSAESGT